MSGVWLDAIFSPVRRTAFATLGTTYTNATTSYTTVIAQTVTLGRFSQTGNTTQLAAHAKAVFTTASGTAAVFALLINGTYYEVDAQPVASGGSSQQPIYTPYPAPATPTTLTGQRLIGYTATGGTPSRIWLVSSDAVTASDTNFRSWTFQAYDADGNDLGEVGTLTTMTSGSGGTGSLAPWQVGAAGISGTPPELPAGATISAYDGSGGAGFALADSTIGVDFESGGGGGSVGVGSATIDVLVSLPLGSYTVSLVAKLDASDTLTIDPSTGHRATLELVEYSAPTS